MTSRGIQTLSTMTPRPGSAPSACAAGMRTYVRPSGGSPEFLRGRRAMLSRRQLCQLPARDTVYDLLSFVTVTFLGRVAAHRIHDLKGSSCGLQRRPKGHLGPCGRRRRWKTSAGAVLTNRTHLRRTGPLAPLLALRHNVSSSADNVHYVK